MVELLTLLVLCSACCTCTLISTPRVLAPPPVSSGPEAPVVEEGVGGDMGVATMTLQREVQENMIMATTPAVDALMSNSTQVSHDRKVTSLSSVQSQLDRLSRPGGRKRRFIRNLIHRLVTTERWHRS